MRNGKPSNVTEVIDPTGGARKDMSGAGWIFRSSHSGMAYP